MRRGSCISVLVGFPRIWSGRSSEKLGVHRRMVREALGSAEPAAHPCLCRCLSRNPAISARVGSSLAVLSLRHTKKAVNVRETRMNSNRVVIPS